MEERFINALKEAMEMEGKEIQLSDNFREYDEWGSLAQLSVIAMLDEEFEVEIENKDFEKLITVNDLLEEIKKRSA